MSREAGGVLLIAVGLVLLVSPADEALELLTLIYCGLSLYFVGSVAKS